jgi:hypothetical protein
LVDAFPGFSQNSFENQQVAACRSPKEFCANPRNVLTNRKRAIIHSCLQKSLVNSKDFGDKRLRTYYLKIK